MLVTCKVIEESARLNDGVEYVSASCMEQGEHMLLQFFDYNLRADEAHLKGKMKDKSFVIRWETIRSIFGGRPQVQGRIVKEVAK